MNPLMMVTRLVGDVITHHYLSTDKDGWPDLSTLGSAGCAIYAVGGSAWWCENLDGSRPSGLLDETDLRIGVVLDARGHLREFERWRDARKLLLAYRVGQEDQEDRTRRQREAEAG